MRSLLILLAIFGLIYYYYSEPISIKPPETEQKTEQGAKTEEKEDASSKKVVKKRLPQRPVEGIFLEEDDEETTEKVRKPVKEEPVKKEVAQEEPPQEEAVQVEPPQPKPLPELSSVITSKARHPYADPDKYPLHYAISKNNLEQVKQILKKEDLANEQGEVILGVKECHCKENPYEICSCEASLVMPPLNLAIFKRNDEIIKYLLRKKANPLTKDEMGRNAFDIAKQQNMAYIQDLLTKYTPTK